MYKVLKQLFDNMQFESDIRQETFDKHQCEPLNDEMIPSLLSSRIRTLETIALKMKINGRITIKCCQNRLGNINLHLFEKEKNTIHGTHFDVM